MFFLQISMEQYTVRISNTIRHLPPETASSKVPIDNTLILGPFFGTGCLGVRVKSDRLFIDMLPCWAITLHETGMNSPSTIRPGLFWFYLSYSVLTTVMELKPIECNCLIKHSLTSLVVPKSNTCNTNVSV